MRGDPATGDETPVTGGLAFSYVREESGAPTESASDKYAGVYLQVDKDTGGSTTVYDFLALMIEPETMSVCVWQDDSVTQSPAIEATSDPDVWYDVQVTWNAQGNVSVKRAEHGVGAFEEIFSSDIGDVLTDSQYIGVGTGTADGAYRFDNIRLSNDSPTSTGLRNTEYLYDAVGRRIGKTVTNPVTQETKTTYYMYAGDRIIEELDGNGTVVARYVYGLYVDEPLQMHRDDDNDGLDSGDPVYYYHTDYLYNVMALTNASGAVVEKYEYDDYGKPKIWDSTNSVYVDLAESPVGNPYFFTGRQWDPETHFYYYRSRYYEPGLGRFLSRDSIGIWGDAANMGNGQAYVNNNPWSGVDPFGKGPSKDLEHLVDPKAWLYGICKCVGDLFEFSFGGHSNVDNNVYYPAKGGVGGVVGGPIRVVTFRMVPIEECPSQLSLAGMELGASYVIVLDPAQRLVTGETAADRETSRLRAAFDLTLDVVFVTVAAKGKPQTIKETTVSLSQAELDDIRRTGKAANPSEVGNSFVNLASERRTQHILHGDATGGGHMYPGGPGKSPFPKDWSENRIMHEISDVATDPRIEWEQITGQPGSLYTKAGTPSRFAAIGTRDGVEIKVIIEPAGEGVISGYPTNTGSE